MIRTAIITRSSDGKTPLLQVQIEDAVHYKRLAKKDLLHLLWCIVQILVEDA